MKRFLFLILIIALIGCSKKYIQLIETFSNNSFEKNGFWVYEDDTVKITYYFWAKNGIMAFYVYNKLDKPIYIDWKNSSFILEGKKLNYWNDEIQSNSTSNYKEYYYGGVWSNSVFGMNKGTINTSTNTFKPERVTFIPSKSNYTRAPHFYLLPNDNFKLNPNCKLEVVKKNDKPKKNTTVFTQTFDENDSPFVFRNYLAISFSESSNEYIYIDNGFYMSAIKEMDKRHFNGKYLGSDEFGNLLYEAPFRKGTSFYVFKEIIPKKPVGVYTGDF